MTAKPEQTLPRFSLSIDETAESIGTSRQTVYDLINAGELDSFKIGRRRLISTEAIQRWIRAKEAKEVAANDREDEFFQGGL